MTKKPRATARPASRPSTRRQIQQTMEEASRALAEGRYFDCERLADQALHAAWELQDYESLSRITLPLQEARRQRRLAAADAGAVFTFADKIPKPGDPLKPGCYIVFPPNVGADARQISASALEQGVPVIAFAREPLTKLGRLPVVVVGPSTVRTHLTPPEQMTSEWCLFVLESLERQALQSIDPQRALDRQVDEAVNLLDALPESELLHQRLSELAHEAAHNTAMLSSRRRRRAASDDRLIEDEDDD